MIATTAIFDIGKTNKKFLLFNDAQELVHEVQVTFEEIEDEDGAPCEDLKKLTDWLLQTWKAIQQDTRFHVKALNFTTYGASFVHLDAQGQPVTPLYNYLKKFPEDLSAKFYETYGDKLAISTDTASPVLGMLNSGLQIYWLKYRHPSIFKKIKTSLHLPQYCSWLFSKQLCAEFTSIGCHTMLWHHDKNDYHNWVYAEGIDALLPPIMKQYHQRTTSFRNIEIPVGTGLHDSSAALIPYLKKFKEEFLLLSTGTWCITLNPFAKHNLTEDDLEMDCLNYLTFAGQQVKASRLFTGNNHENLTKRFASHFYKDKDYYKNIVFDASILEVSKSKPTLLKNYLTPLLPFALPDLDTFDTYEQAYHKLLWDMTQLQAQSVLLAGENAVDNKRLFVDGGFSKNPIFMQLLQEQLPTVHVEAFELSQGTALGAALVMS